LIQYEDDEGDKVTLEGQKDWERGVKRHLKMKAKSLKLWVKVRKQKATEDSD